MDINISDAQMRAINHFQGPELIIAGPGSGKTFVITKRTQNLIEQYGVDPRRILVITFTKAAALEMEERFLKLMGGKKMGVNFGTFHAIFFKILRYAYHYDASNIIKEEEKYAFFRQIIAKLELEIEDEKEFMESIISEVSMVKSERMDMEHYYSLNTSEENFRIIYKEYERRMQASQKIDFDDMMVLCYELLTKRPDILKLWQQQYQFIMVDEAQDSNTLQYEITRLLSADNQNIFWVGDDDQSLYRFRGAKPEIMLNFHQDYPEGESVILDFNYRSQSKIVEGALRVINNNTKRYKKNILAVRKPGQDIVIMDFLDVSKENRNVLETVRVYQEKGGCLNDIAVLFRTHSQPRALIELFMEYNIPFKMKDAIPNIYEHWIAKNIVDYIRVAMGSRERSIFLRIINRPKRYISRDCFGEANVDFYSLKRFFQDKPYVVERIEKLEYDIKMLCNMSPLAALNYIRHAIGYEEYLKEYAQYRRIKVEELFEILDELKESAKNYNTYEEWFFHMEEYKQELILQGEKRTRRDVEGITMTTFHGAKGLEFDLVFLIDANEGITPHNKALTTADMEEERRMFYVAMTRAKNALHIYSVKERYNKELDCSRFVGELLFDSKSLEKGARLHHKIYGEGSIISIDEKKIVVKFDHIILAKKLDVEYCRQNHMIKAL